MIGRRRLLGLGALAATGVAGGRAALGFQLQEMSAPTARAYQLACEAPAKHAQLLAEIDAQLAGRVLGDGEIAAIKQAARCPLCGCALTAAAGPTTPPQAAAGPTTPPQAAAEPKTPPQADRPL